MINKEFFTKREQIILKSMDDKFEWIARDKYGLWVFAECPTFNEDHGFFADGGEYGKLTYFDHIFLSITCDNTPVQFKRTQIISEKTKRYLESVLQPLDDVACLIIEGNPSSNGCRRLHINFKNGNYMLFPYMSKDMFSGMVKDIPYTPKKLGLKLDYIGE